jgi:hypothetical protein
MLGVAHDLRLWLDPVYAGSNVDQVVGDHAQSDPTLHAGKAAV